MAPYLTLRLQTLGCVNPVPIIYDCVLPVIGPVSELDVEVISSSG